MDSNKVRKLTFTGSTAVGKQLLQQSAHTVKNVSLELGGNAPFLVFDDADIQQALAAAIASRFRNAGQTCVCANRFLVQANIYEQFSQGLASLVSQLKVGNGLQEETQIGPLINEKAVLKVERLLADAVAKGATIITGGKRHTLGGTYFEPTVLTDLSTEMDIFHEEIFGPVATVMPFQTEQEALAIANNSPYGLAAYCYSRDISRVWRVAEGLEYGMVGMNEGIISTEVAPFGGVKESGLGREGGYYGLDEFLEVKYICIGDIA
jgi:succinate-semialdehyde dehydrogenase/glutarate-semialdehyde dehydrogenase